MSRLPKRTGTDKPLVQQIVERHITEPAAVQLSIIGISYDPQYLEKFMIVYHSTSYENTDAAQSHHGDRQSNNSDQFNFLYLDSQHLLRLEL